MAFAFDVVDTVRAEEPDLFDDELAEQVAQMLEEAVDAEAQFAEDLLGGRASPGMSTGRHARLPASTSPTGGWRGSACRPIYGSTNPFAFMELQDVQELSNFFERRVSAYQVGVTGTVGFDEDF